MFTERVLIMQPFHRLLPSTTLALCLVASLSNPAEARQTSVTGSIGTGMDIRDRSYDQTQSGNNNNDQQKIFISPTITLSSLGVYDSISLQYTPSFNYDFVDNNNSVDHSLSFNGKRLLTSRWSVSLTDNYTLSDDPDTSSSYTTTDSESNSSNGSSDTTSQDTLSQDNFGSKYWTNAASIRSSYALFEKTSLSGGYTYSVLRNDGSQGSGNDAYNEYDKHAFFTNLSHGINAYWRTNLGLNYTRGLYDQPPAASTTASSNPNLDQYGLNFGVDYIQSVQDFFPFQYNLSETQYDGDTRNDTQSQNWSIGWNHSFDPQTSFSIGGGPSYVKTEGLDGTWGYNAYLTLTKQFQHATCSLQLDKRYETNNFSGTDDSGLSDTYNARARVAYQYTKDLGIDFFGRYSKQSQIDPQGIYLSVVNGAVTETQTGDNTYDTNIYETGVGLRYAFGRWYTAGLKYSYYVSDGQLDGDQYDEHRILFSISATKELWRW
ncbi:MAG: hypothetical protein PHI97_14235 [Desulfobulbus sp.]|nr:hypothetical protein [Desulfobulbus sp.]